MKLQHLDLFSGIGGFSLALEKAELAETRAFCDIDKFCQKVLKKHWEHVPIYSDIKELNYEKLKADGINKIDIITGGYPCQPFSIAGRKKGEEDPRHLWPEYFRLVKELRPTWVIGENVSGHIKQGLDTVLEDLESEGYSTRTFSISASSVGANHKRERVWVLANSGRSLWEGSELSRENGNEIAEGNANQSERSSGTPKLNVADSKSINSDGRGHQEYTEAGHREGQVGGESGSKMADSNSERQQEQWGSFTTQSKGEIVREKSECSGSREGDVADTECFGQSRQGKPVGPDSSKEDPIRKTNWTFDDSQREKGWWQSEPDVGRVAHGIPQRVDRLRSLGNTLVPQIPFMIAKCIKQLEGL